MISPWKRPIDIQDYPRTWLTFQANDIDESNNLVQYLIQDITEAQYEDVITYMLNDYSANEPTCQSEGIKNETQSLKEIQEFWRSALVQNMSIGCFKNGSTNIIGVNVLYVKCKDVKDVFDVEYTGKAFSRIVDTLNYAALQFDAFEHYGVDKYLYGLGLSVNFKYAGRGIGQKLLEARQPLCKAFDVPITVTSFTSDVSQHCAAKVGFETNYQITAWKRCNTSIDYPKTWLNFQARDTDGSNNLVQLTIQDITKEQYDDVIQYLLENFIENQPTFQSAGLSNDTQSIFEVKKLWRLCLEENISIGCFRKDSKEIVGINLLSVIFKNGKNVFNIEPSGKAYSQVMYPLTFIASKFNLFEYYNIDKCLFGLGLSVNSKYAGRGIAQKLLEAREPICKYFDIPVSGGVFNTEISQHCGNKAGYENIYEVTYDELAEAEPSMGFSNIKHKSIKVMCIDFRTKIKSRI